MTGNRRMRSATAALAALMMSAALVPASAQDLDLGTLPVDGKFGDVTLRISAIAGPYADGFKKFEKEIREELGIQMEFELIPPTEAFTKDMLEFRSQSASSDIVLFMPANLADYSRFLVPLDKAAEQLGLSFEKDDIEAVYRNVYTTWGGTMYSIPWDGDQHNLFYNKAVFADETNQAEFKAKYGYDLAPPKTWAEYKDIAEFMNGRDINGDGTPDYGVAEAWQRGGYAVWWWTNKFAANGGVWFDADMKPLINSESGVKALQNSIDIRDFAPPGVLNFGYPELEAALLKQQVPMVIQWSSTGKAAQSKDVSDIVGNVGIAMVPGTKLADGTIVHRPALPTGWAAGVPLFSKNAAAAVSLLAWISTPERSLELALDPGTAVDAWRASAFANVDAWKAAFPEDPTYGEAFINVQRETVLTGLPDLQIPGSAEYLTALDREIGAALAGEKSAKEALDAAAAAWEAITDKLGREAQAAAWANQAAAMESIGIRYEPTWAQ